ncbi:hypothetical protein Q8A67_020939 [Cirrhinus molitorella]|uniref:Uncharacterized protein n=1 Tax=Cirrhinus molitorella TaxID=172907 RepID=A0AA88TD86_9TELE|nr:hypothetical protein Q8A67_020939 [Cirrhinus molitorella]
MSRGQGGCNQDIQIPSHDFPSRSRLSSKEWEELSFVCLCAQDEPVEETLASQVASLLKRSKSHQFYGLMGKRSEVVQPVKMERRRHKGDMFVGLMGKRSLGGDFRKTIPESSTAMDKSGDLNKQTADVRDEWDRLQYY